MEERKKQHVPTYIVNCHAKVTFVICVDVPEVYC